MYTPMVPQMLLLALAVRVGVVGGAPAAAGVATPTPRIPPTGLTPLDLSRGSYDRSEEREVDRGERHDRENSCESGDCFHDSTGSRSSVDPDDQRSRQVSHIYLMQNSRDASREIISGSKTSRGQEEISGTTTNSGLFTWSWLDDPGRKEEQKPISEPDTNTEGSFLEQYSSYILHQVGASSTKEEEALGIDGSWSLPLRFGLVGENGTEVEGGNAHGDNQGDDSVTPSSNPTPYEKIESYAGHQWLTTDTVTDTPISVTVTTPSRATYSPPVDAPTGGPIIHLLIDPSRQPVPVHKNTRRSTTSYTDTPLPTSPVFTKTSITTPESHTTRAASSTTSKPKSTVSPRTLTPRFTSYPRTSKPLRTTTPTEEPIMLTQQTLPSSKVATLRPFRFSETPPTIEELTFLLANQYVTSNYTTSKLHTESDPAPDEPSEHQTDPIITAEERPAFVTFSYVSGNSTDSPEVTTTKTSETLTTVSEPAFTESTKPENVFTYTVQQSKGSEQSTTEAEQSSSPGKHSGGTSNPSKRPEQSSLLLGQDISSEHPSVIVTQSYDFYEQESELLDQPIREQLLTRIDQPFIVTETSKTTESPSTTTYETRSTSEESFSTTNLPTTYFEQRTTAIRPKLKDIEEPVIYIGLFTGKPLAYDESTADTQQTNEDTKQTHSQPEHTTPPGIQLTTVGNEATINGGSSTISLYYSNRLPSQEYGDSAPAIPSGVGQIIGQLISASEESPGVSQDYSAWSTTTIAPEAATSGELITFTENDHEQTSPPPYEREPSTTHSTTYPATELSEQGKFSPWTTPFTTAVTPSKNYLATLLNQTLALLSNRRPASNNKYSFLTPPPGLTTPRTTTERVSFPFSLITAKPITTATQRTPDETSQSSGGGSGVKGSHIPGESVYIDSLLSHLTTTTPNPHNQGQSISCEDVGQFSELLDFYGILYPGLENPCKKTPRQDSQVEEASNASTVKPEKELGNHHNKRRPTRPPGYAQGTPLSTTKTPVIITNASFGLSTYRIPKPIIVSSGYSGHTVLSPSSFTPSATTQSPIVQTDETSNDSSYSVTVPNDPLTETTTETNEMDTTISVQTYPYLVYFPKRHTPFYIGGSPQTITTPEEGSQFTPSKIEATEETSVQTSTQTSSSLLEDPLEREPTFSFGGLESKPTATLVSEDGISTDVTVVSLNPEFPSSQTVVGEEDDTKWVKISIEPSEITLTTASSTSKRLKPSSTTTVKPTTEKEHSPLSITSIWGNWYNRWSSSRTEVTSAAPANKTEEGMKPPTTTSPLSPLSSVNQKAPLFSRQETQSISKLNTPQGSKDTTSVELESPSVTLSTAISATISQTAADVRKILSTTPRSTLYATSQTTPLSAQPKCSKRPITGSPTSSPLSESFTQLPIETSNETKPPEEKEKETFTMNLVSQSTLQTQKDKLLFFLGATEDITTQAVPTTETPEINTKKALSMSGHGNSTNIILSTTSTPLTRVLDSLWNIFRREPSAPKKSNDINSGDPKNEDQIKDDTDDEEEVTLPNTISPLPSSTIITELAENSTVHTESTEHEENNRHLQRLSKEKPLDRPAVDPSTSSKNETQDPTKSPTAANLPSSIESLDNLFSLLGKFGKDNLFGGNSKTPEKEEDDRGTRRRPDITRHQVTRPPHVSQPARGSGTVTYRPISAHNRHRHPDSRISTQRPAIILKKQGSRVHVPLIPSADFSSFQPYSSGPMKMMGTLFRPRDEMIGESVTMTPGVPFQPIDTLPPNIIRSRLGEVDNNAPNNVRGTQTEPRVEDREWQEPPPPPPPPLFRPHTTDTNSFRQRRCGKRLRDRLDHLLGRELVMDQFGVRVYSSVVESILAAECNTLESPNLDPLPFEAPNRGPLPLVSQSTTPSPLNHLSVIPSLYRPAATFGMDGWLSLDDLKAKAEEERLQKHRENIPQDDNKEETEEGKDPSYEDLLRNHRLVEPPFDQKAAPLLTTPRIPNPTDPQVSSVSSSITLGSAISFGSSLSPVSSTSSPSSPPQDKLGFLSPLPSSVPSSFTSPSLPRAMPDAEFLGHMAYPSSAEEDFQITSSNFSVFSASSSSSIIPNTATQYTISVPLSSQTSTPPTQFTTKTTPFSSLMSSTVSSSSSSQLPDSSTQSASFDSSTQSASSDSSTQSVSFDSSTQSASSDSSTQSASFDSFTHLTPSIPSTSSTSSGQDSLSLHLTLSTKSTPPTTSTIRPSTSSTSSLTLPPSSEPLSESSSSRSRRFAKILRNPSGMALGAGMLALNSVALSAASPIEFPQESPSLAITEPTSRALSTTVFGFETILTGLVYLSFGIFLYQMIQRAVDSKVLGSFPASSSFSGRDADNQFDAASLLQSLEEVPEIASGMMLVGLHGAEVWTKHPKCLPLYLCRANSPNPLSQARQPALAFASSAVTLWAGVHDPQTIIAGTLATWKGAHGYPCDFAQNLCLTDRSISRHFRPITNGV